MQQDSEASDRGRREEEEIVQTKAVLQALYERSRGGERDARRSGLRTPVFAGLNSGGEESPASALILNFITNLNTLLDAVRRGRLFRSFSEDERRTLAGFTYKLGKCAVTAARYHGADDAVTIGSLLEFVRGYTPSAVDGALRDAVGGYSAADYWSDAKASLTRRVAPHSAYCVCPDLRWCAYKLEMYALTAALCRANLKCMLYFKCNISVISRGLAKRIADGLSRAVLCEFETHAATLNRPDVDSAISRGRSCTVLTFGLPCACSDLCSCPSDSLSHSAIPFKFEAYESCDRRQDTTIVWSVFRDQGIKQDILEHLRP